MNLSPPHRRSHAGFTLIELIVSVAILTLLFAVVSQSISVVMKASVSGRQQASKSLDARAIFDLFGTDLKMGVFRDDLASFRDENGTSEVVFLTKRSALGGDRELSLVEFQLNSSTGELLRSSVPIPWQPAAGQPVIGFNQPATLPFAALLSQQTPIPLAEGVLAFQVYFLDENGTYQNQYNNNNTKVARVALAICDTETADILKELNLLSTISSRFAQQTTLQTSYLNYWTDLMEDNSFVATVPADLRGNIKVFERTYRLPHQ